MDRKDRPKPSLGRKIVRVLSILGGAYALLIAAVFFFGDRMVFFPQVDTEADWTLPEHAKEVWFASPGGPRLHAWFFETPKAKWTLLVCHGNAGNIAGRRDTYDQMAALGVNVFAFDYRGYGKSAGSPSEDGFYADAVAAFDYLATERGIPSDSIIVMGQSLGSTAATYAALNRKCGGLILEAPLANASSMAAKILPFPPVGWALPMKLDNLGRIGGIRCPVLIVHGTDDRVVPFEQGKRLFEAANQPKWHFPIPGAGHNDLWSAHGAEYSAAIQRLLTHLDSRSEGTSLPAVR